MKILDPGNETLDHQSKHEKDHQDQADVYSPNSQESHSISHPPDPENAFN